MKKILTTLTILIFISFLATGQTTITANDAPLFSSYSVYDLPISSINSPAKGNNQNWDYSSGTPISTLPIAYITETDNFWTAMGVDFYRNLNKYISPNQFYFKIEKKMDHSTNGIFEKGIYIPAQAYDISPTTGNAGDSIKYPAQNIVHSSPIVYMPFPLTANYNNKQSTRVSVNFIINAPLLGMNNVPCKQVYYDIRKDSAIGWGKMRVYTPSGPSGYHDVLMQKRQQYYLDSFYVNGAPISAPLQAAFGISQGQRTQDHNAIEFKRRGSFLYLLRLYTGTDSTCTNITDAFSDANHTTPLGINNLIEQNFASILYPNPAINMNIKLMIIGNKNELINYSIIDISGKIIASEKTNWQGNNIVLPTKNLVRGTYFLNIKNKENATSFSETFQIK